MGVYDDVFAALHQADVPFVVVGGTAVVLQGHPRLTVDLDLVVDLAPPRALSAVRALTALGLRPRLPVPAEQFADPQTRQTWVDERLQVFTFHGPRRAWREVDVFAVAPLPLPELLRDATRVRIGGVDVAVASRDHLVRMKRAAGRPQDLADVEALEALEALEASGG